MEGTFKARRPIFPESCPTDRHSSVRGNEGPADGPTEDKRAGGPDLDPEDRKKRRVPSADTRTHRHTHTDEAE